MARHTGTRTRTRTPTPAPAQVNPFERALGGFDEKRLAALLERRRDLAWPAPRSLSELLRRAGHPQSISRALDHVDLPTSYLLRAVLAVGGISSIDQVRELLGLDDATAVEEAASKAEGLLLLARRGRGGDELLAHTALDQVLRTGRLGPSVGELLEQMTVEQLAWVARCRELEITSRRKSDLVKMLAAAVSDGELTRELISGAPGAVQEVVAKMSRGGSAGYPVYDLYPSPYLRHKPNPTPVEWLAWRGFVMKRDWYGCVMPREVTLALRHGRLFDDVRTDPPVITARSRLPEAISEAGALDAAGAIVEDVEAAVSAIAVTPAKLLKAGGVGVRELRRIAKEAELAEERAVLALELAGVADLVGYLTNHLEPSSDAAPTAAFDVWCEDEFGERWWRLASNWLAVEGFPSFAGCKDTDDKLVPPLRLYGATSDAARQREVVLTCLAGLAPGEPADVADVVEVLRWEAPLAAERGPSNAVRHVAWVLDEATAFGVVAGGAITGIGRHLLAGEREPAVKAVSGHRGSLSTELVLQADLTAVVAGSTPRWFRERLAQMAEVESKGAAIVYRIGEASLRRAFDAGLGAEDILSFLGEHARKGVPQALSYLVEDVARRYGTVRVGAATSYVRLPDAATAAELVNSRKLARLGLRQLSPTVLISTQPSDKVIDTLRGAGYLPALEDGGGGLLIARRSERRANQQIWEDRVGPPDGGDDALPLSALAATLIAAGMQPAPAPAGAAHASRTGMELRLFRTDERDEPDEPDEYEDLDVHFDGDELDELDELDEPDEPEDDLCADGECDCPRPDAIVRDPSEIADVLAKAAQHTWLVRAALPGLRGRERTFYAYSMEVSETGAELIDIESVERLEVLFSDVIWARVATEPEEVAIGLGGLEP